MLEVHAYGTIVEWDAEVSWETDLLNTKMNLCAAHIQTCDPHQCTHVKFAMKNDVP